MKAASQLNKRCSSVGFYPVPNKDMIRQLPVGAASRPMQRGYWIPGKEQVGQQKGMIFEMGTYHRHMNSCYAAGQ